jgi:signal peptidase
MSPLLGVGDVVVAEPYHGSVLGPGTVIVFHAPGSEKLTTHRIVAVDADGTYRTRGDANTVADSTPVPASAIVAVGRLRVPFIGLPVAWWQTGNYPPLVATLLLLAVAAFFRNGGRSSDDDPHPATSRHGWLSRLARIGAVLMVVAVVATHFSAAAFAATAQNGGNAWRAGNIFPSARSSTARTIGDASGGGTPANASDPLSYAGDTKTKTTGNWASAFSSSRYFQLAYEAPLAGGQAVSGAAFVLDYAANGAYETACFYFNVRQASTSTVLATYGSAASPVDCQTGTTLKSKSTATPIITTTDIANDLAIRVYATESGARPITIDRATVTGSTAYQSFVLYEKSSIDASTGTATTTPWSLATADGTAYPSAAYWTSAYSSARYLSFTFGAYVPTGAAVTAVTLTHTWKGSAAGKNFCYFIQVYNATTLLGSHGSSSAPYQCDNTATYVTDTISPPEAASVANANAVTIKLYAWDANTGKSSQDLLQLAVTYSLP